jgi:hypothetical protein
LERDVFDEEERGRAAALDEDVVQERRDAPGGEFERDRLVDVQRLPPEGRDRRGRRKYGRRAER